MKIMRQIVWRSHGKYDVEKIWKQTEKIKPKRIQIDKLKHNLDKDNWTVKIKGKNKYVTPNQVIANPYTSPNDFCKIIQADLSYPIIVYMDDISGDLDVLDGLHRLSLATILGRKTINVKYVCMEILEKTKI